MHCPKYREQIGFEPARHIKDSRNPAVKTRNHVLHHPSEQSSTKQSSDGMTHQRRTSLLTKDEQSTSSIGSTLPWSLISSGACIRASLKILRLPLFSPQVSPAAPTP
jgi:hypothetical protein